MDLRSTEKLIIDKEDGSIAYSQMPIYNIIHIKIDWVIVNRIDDWISFRGKRIVFPYQIPCEVDAYITYLTDDWDCGECLSIGDMVKKYYNHLYGTDDNEYIDWHEEDQVVDYLKEALMIIRNEKADHRTTRQYSFQIGTPIENFSCHDTRCRNDYRDIDYIPKDGLAMTKTGVYLPYQVVKGKVKFEKMANINTEGAYFGYLLPKMGTIHEVRLDGKRIDFTEYKWYYFFPKVTGIVTIWYYNEILVGEDCCIDFDMNFSRLPVLYALYNIMYDRWDARAQSTERKYDMLLQQYKLYLRKVKAKDANSSARQMPRKTRTAHKKSLSGGRYINTDLI